MRITINLATRPFVELRRVYLRLRLAMLALAVVALALGVGNYLLGKRAAAAEAQVNQVRQQIAAVDQQRQADQRRMQQPDNRAVLDQSRFLNALFARKAFSWTTVMMELERVLPAGVQVTSIEPALTPHGNVTIRLRVSGDRERAVELVRNLERSPSFRNPHLANESAQTEENGRPANVAPGAPPAGVEFDILSGYNSLLTDAAAVPNTGRAGAAPGGGAR